MKKGRQIIGSLCPVNHGGHIRATNEKVKDRLYYLDHNYAHHQKLTHTETYEKNKQHSQKKKKKKKKKKEEEEQKKKKEGEKKKEKKQQKRQKKKKEK